MHIYNKIVIIIGFGIFYFTDVNKLGVFFGNLVGAEEYLSKMLAASLKIRRISEKKHIFTHIEWRMTGVMGETKEETLPEGWVWASREALQRTYAVPNAFQPFQAKVISDLIQKLEAGEALGLESKKIISEEKGFDATTITQEDIDTYGLGE